MPNKSNTLNYNLDPNINYSDSVNYNNRTRAYDSADKFFELRKKEIEELYKIDEKAAKKQEDELNKLKEKNTRKRLDNERDYIKELYDEIDEERFGKYKKVHDEFKDVQKAFEDGTIFDKVIDKIPSIAANVSDLLTNKLDPIINNYIDKQTYISAHLSGSSSSLSQLTDNLQNTLSTSGLVRQEAVYNKLASLVESGIVSNVEQKAFLLTLADDMHMTFDAANGNLARLMRLQGEDLTANRLALTYNLQEFLNATYENSQYIRDAFQDVSNSLLEMRALNTGTGAGVENTLQTWLGALYSNGLSSSTATSLAGAFNALGSGDISNLGSGIANLVLMGVARAGLDYGDILNSGLNANQTNQIMSGISTYLQEMGANSSNVVKSQLASIFGVNVADLIAASNTGVVNTTMNDNIGNLFGDYSSFVSLPAQWKNMFNNMMYTWGTNIASSPLAYGSYEIEKLLAANLSPIAGGLFGEQAGNLVAALPLITLLPTLLQTVVGDIVPSIGANSKGLSSIFSALGGLNNSTTVKVSGGGTSASAYIGNGDMSGVFSNTRSSALNISDTLNVEGLKAEWEDNVQLITENSMLMLEIMQDTMHDMRENINIIKNDVDIVMTLIPGAGLVGAVAGEVSGRLGL